MDNLINTWLFDILNSIEELEGYFPNGKHFGDYSNDTRTRRAVERNIEIIGEAMTRILRESPNIQISNTRKIVSARNKIIHGYDEISDDVIWGIIINHLPLLKSEVDALLKDNDSPNRR